MKEKGMCQQKVALEMILTQPDKGGMSEAAILLHRKQCEDTERMEKRMTELEKKVDVLDRKVDNLDGKIDEIKELVSVKTSFIGNIKDILSNKVFLYILITLLCAAFGVSVGEVGTFLFKG